MSSTIRKRRIQPIAVTESDAEAPGLLPQAQLELDSAVRRPASPPPVEPGRRIWIDWSTGYDFNYRKLLAHAGVKPLTAASQRTAAAPADTAAHEQRDLVEALNADRSAHVFSSFVMVRVLVRTGL